jgi:4-carboxymuconolactone decarboxylase
MPDSVLGRGRAALVAVAAALATRDAAVIRQAMTTAAAVCDPGEVDEVILQSHLFVGFPDALNALVLWREVGGGPPRVEAVELAGQWAERGGDVCATVYGRNYGKLRRNVCSLHPDLDRWMVEGGYGRVIGRDGLDLATRELCIAALLAVWNVPRQLHSHLRGALNAGATPSEVEAALGIACALLDVDRADAVRALWSEVVGPRAASTRG